MFRIDGYCTSDRIMLRHGLSKTVTLYRLRDESPAELTLNIRVLTRRGTFAIEVLHIATPNSNAQGGNVPARKASLGPKRTTRNRHHSHTKPQKFDGISAKIVLNSLSVRLQQEQGRLIEEMTNFIYKINH